MLVFPVPVFASQATNSEYVNTANHATEDTKSELPPELAAFCKTMLLGGNMKKGDVRILSQNNGEEFCVEVLDNEQTTVVPRSVTTTTTLFTFYIKNSAGKRVDLFKVFPKATWIRGDRITNFECTYEIVKTGVKCSWDNNYNHASSTFCTRALDVSYASKSYFIIFSASLNGNKTAIDIDCSEGPEL